MAEKKCDVCGKPSTVGWTLFNRVEAYCDEHDPAPENREWRKTVRAQVAANVVEGKPEASGGGDVRTLATQARQIAIQTLEGYPVVATTVAAVVVTLEEQVDDYRHSATVRLEGK